MDIHSHILPEIDDGAKNVAESVELLEMLKEQGVTDVVLTPHFYPHLMDANEFFESREESFSKLKSAVSGKNLPRLHIGCEFYYFDRMGTIGDIKSFTLGNSPYILLELNMAAFDAITIQTIENICRMGYIPVFAHIERYLGCRGIRKILKLVKDGKCLAQINAAAVLGGMRKKIFKLIKGDYIYILGSDTHSVNSRPPFMAEALECIAQNCGEEYSKRLMANSDRLCSKIFEERYEE